MKNLIKLYVIFIVLGIVTFPIYAFASSNSGPEVSGEGANVISGWVVSNLSYQLSSNDPSFASGVSFDLDKTAGQVSVRLNSNSTYADCTNVYENHWQCNFSNGIRIASMDEVSVIAVGD